MPPTKDALYLHIECAKYQFQKWKKALDHHPHLYNPVEYLWAGIDVSLAVQLELLKAAQDAILEFFLAAAKSPNALQIIAVVQLLIFHHQIYKD